MRASSAASRHDREPGNRMPDRRYCGTVAAEESTVMLPKLLERATVEYREAGRRASALGPRLSLGPGWNMLLDLFISGVESRRLSVSALCIGARASPATALRYLSILQDAGLVERSLDATDARRSYVQLTAVGWETMGMLLDP